MIRIKGGGDPIDWGKKSERALRQLMALKPGVTEMKAIVTEMERASRKVGRPKKRDALTPAERAKAYRERKRGRQ